MSRRATPHRDGEEQLRALSRALATQPAPRYSPRQARMPASTRNPLQTLARLPRGELAALSAGAVVMLALIAHGGLRATHGALVTALVLLVAAASAGVLWKARCQPLSVAIVLAGVGLCGAYLSYTGPMVRNPDAGSHLAYVQWLLQHHTLPANETCSVCHHPPGFYWLAANAAGLAGWSHALDPEPAMQLVAFGLHALFVVFSVLAIHRLLHAPWQRVIASAIVVFWPYGIIDSARINNDLAVQALAAVAFYFAVRWAQESRTWQLGAACAAAAVGLAFKANAVLVCMVVVGLALLHAARSQSPRAVLMKAAPWLAGLVVLVSLHGAVRGQGSPNLPTRVLGTAYKVDAPEATPRTASYYLTFNPGALVATPYVEAKQFRSQEPSYWNHLVKSSLFGTRNWTMLKLRGAPEPNACIALAMNWALLGLAALLVAGAALSARDRSPASWPCLLAASVYVAGSLAFHLLVPVGHHADFRFIFPVVTPLAILYSAGAQSLQRRHPALGILAAGVAVVFVLGSVAYFLPATFQLALCSLASG